MNKLGFGIGAIAIICATALLLIQHQAQFKLREENESLRQRLDQMDQLEAEHDRLSNLVAHTTSSLANDQLRELLRLRGEVGLLRSQTNKLAGLQEEERRLSATLAAQAENIHPKESWAFAGYATPEAAFESEQWAARTSDTKAYLDSLTYESRQRVERPPLSVQGMMRPANNQFGSGSNSGFMIFLAPDITGYQILNKEVISDDEVILNVLWNPSTDARKVIMKRIGNEWKDAGPVAN